MLKKILGYFMLTLLLLLGNRVGDTAAELPDKSPREPTGTLQKMIVANGDVAMELDLNRLNGIASDKEAKSNTLRFQVAPDSFFTILLFNNTLRGSEPGSMALV